MGIDIKLGYKHTELGVIPTDWEICTLDSITTLLTNGFVGKIKDQYDQSGNGVLYVQGYNVQENGFNFHEIRRISQKFHKQHQRSSLELGDLLTIQTGDIGVTAIVPPALVGANCHALVISRLKKQICDPRYYCHYFNSAHGRTALKAIETGSTMKHLNVGDLKGLLLPLPSIEEQRSIGKILSDADEFINYLEITIKKKKNIKQGAMQELLIGKRRLEKFNDDWIVNKIKDIARVIRGASPRPKGDKRYYGGDIPRLMVEDVTRDGKFVTPKVDFLTKEGEKLSRPCKKGTLTIVCSGTVGIPSFLDKDACIHDGFLALVDIKKNISEDYLYHQLSNLRNKFESSATHGGVFTNLTTSILEEFIVTLPPTKEEQSKIASILSDMDSEIEELEKNKEKYIMLKNGMMQKLLTGEIRVK